VFDAALFHDLILFNLPLPAPPASGLNDAALTRFPVRRAIWRRNSRDRAPAERAWSMNAVEVVIAEHIGGISIISRM
jgi:hypothetical protein